MNDYRRRHCLTFFEELLGFPETTGDSIRRQVRLDDTRLTSLVNECSYEVGTLTTPSLNELRDVDFPTSGQLRLREVVDDAQRLHRDPANAGALFQVASQFNLLEMASPHMTPEDGVGIYEHDHTQGPACAIACGAGTIYRNWLVPIGRQEGQTATCQIDCLGDLADAFDRSAWEMVNGYVMATSAGLREVANEIDSTWGAGRDELMEELRIGVHANTEVTLRGAGHLVTQAYCSALPIPPDDLPDEWEPFARLVLDASYEATMLAAVRNAEETGNRSVFLTFVGGGVFGNRISWIVDAMARAFEVASGADLDVVIVSYGSPTAEIRTLLT